MRTKNEGFHLRSKGGYFEKSKVLGLRGDLEASIFSTTFQEVRFIPTLVLLLPFGLI